GTDVLDGPPVNTTYPLGYFREDYEYVAPTAPDYLDEHNGRFCVTPEYPNGIYCYFTTVDEQWNSTFPYVVGPTFYGVKTAAKVNNITEQVTTYTAGTSDIEFSAELQQQVSVFPNPSNELIAVQFNNVAQQNYTVELYDELGKLINQTTLFQGSTIAYFDARTLYNGAYIVRISNGALQATKKVLIAK
ncbi:MAG: YHYH protein, partial [Candidatus Kapabacteria bacterium]|nr:YHYH protein [Candidatus Kapabacteria bacterium]